MKRRTFRSPERSRLAEHRDRRVRSHARTPVGVAWLLISVQTASVEYRGIRYTIRVRIEREQWSVAIHPGGVEMAGKVIIGPREDAELHAHYLIDKWLEKTPRKNTKEPSKIYDDQHT